MKISVTVASRQRTHRLIDGIHGLIELADNVDSIEFLCRFDDDDEHSYNQFKNCCDKDLGQYNIKCYIGKRFGYGNLQKYFHELIELSTSPIIFLYTDSVMMETKGWDSILKDKLLPENYESIKPGKYPLEKFKVLNIKISNENYTYNARGGYPYKMFHWAVPKIYYDICGRIAPAPQTDHWLQNVCNPLGLVKGCDISMKKSIQVIDSNFREKLVDVKKTNAPHRLSGRQGTTEQEIDREKIKKYFNITSAKGAKKERVRK